MAVRERISKLIGPFILIAIGVILLLYMQDLISVGIWDLVSSLVPLAVIALAFSMLLGGGSVFLPLVLIVFASGFFLNSLDWVDWDIWPAMGQFWPLLLVAVGVDVLLGPRLGYISTHEESLSEPLEESVQMAEIRVNHGIGNLMIDTSAPEGLLLSASAQLTQCERLEKIVHRDAARIKVKLGQAVRWYFPFTGAWILREGWQISLNPTLPTRLQIDGGVGVREIDLQDASLEYLKIDGGLGTTRIQLPTRGRLKAKIDTGLGDTSVIIPETMEVRIKIEGGLGSSNVHGDLNQMAKRYYSLAYETAEESIDLYINHGIGSLTVTKL